MLDVAIIGAGPVGLATAAALLQSLDSNAALYAVQVTQLTQPCCWPIVSYLGAVHCRHHAATSLQPHMCIVQSLRRNYIETSPLAQCVMLTCKCVLFNTADALRWGC